MIDVVMQPVTGCVALNVYTPAAVTLVLAAVAFENVPGPVHCNAEPAGITFAVNDELVWVQVIAVGVVGKEMVGALTS